MFLTMDPKAEIERIFMLDLDRGTRLLNLWKTVDVHGNPVASWDDVVLFGGYFEDRACLVGVENVGMTHVATLMLSTFYERCEGRDRETAPA